MGSGIDEFLREDGIFEDSQAQAIKEVVAYHLDVNAPLYVPASESHSRWYASVLATPSTQPDSTSTTSLPDINPRPALAAT